MYRKILGLFLLLVCSCPARAQVTQYVHAGFNLGSLAPMGLSNTIREVKGWWPLFSPSLGYEAVYAIDKKWSIGASLKLEYKGMGIRDSVLYFHTIVTVNNGSQTGHFEGDFSGINKTTARNGYLTLPVYAVYATKNWRYKLGLYMAYLVDARFDGTVSDGYIRNGNSLGEKVLISSATFDFADQERTFDWGIHAGAERKLHSRWGITGDLEWGLQPVFPADFKGVGFNLYNIFFALGASYRL